MDPLLLLEDGTESKPELPPSARDSSEGTRVNREIGRGPGCANGEKGVPAGEEVTR